MTLFTKIILCAVCVLLFSASPTPYQIGDEVADFTLQNVDGKPVSLSNFPSAKGFVIVFTSNRCPVAKAYDNRLITLNNDYANRGYPLILINPNDPTAYAAESFERMQELAESKRFRFPYLQDNDAEIATVFGASRTPEAFVLNKEAGKIMLRYAGKIDDNAHDAKGVTQSYVREAIERLLKNQPIKTPSTTAVGCGIKWEG